MKGVSDRQNKWILTQGKRRLIITTGYEVHVFIFLSSIFADGRYYPKNNLTVPPHPCSRGRCRLLGAFVCWGSGWFPCPLPVLRHPCCRCQLHFACSGLLHNRREHQVRVYGSLRALMTIDSTQKNLQKSRTHQGK